MTELIISRRMHPNEVTAFSLARNVYERLKSQIDVEMLSIPYELSFLSYLQSTDGIDISSEEELIKRMMRGHEWLIREATKYGSRVPIVDFHNCHNNTINPSNKPVEEMRFSRVSVRQENFLRHMNREIFLLYDTRPPEPYFVLEIPAIYKPITERLREKFDRKLKGSGLNNEWFGHEYSIVDYEKTHSEGLDSDTMVNILVDGLLNVFQGS